MARKSKRLVLNEAIRQGQAKIAEGLKTGQMRSERSHGKSDIEDPESILTGKSRSTNGRKSDFFKSRDISSKFGNWTSKRKATVLIYVASAVLLGLAVWMILAVGNSDRQQPGGNSSGALSSETGINSGTGSERQANSSETPVFFGGRTESSQPAQGETSVVPPVGKLPQGDNVIWIQSIAGGRRDELKPVAAFFESKGIATEIIIDRASGLAVLVTKAGFEENPGTRGTDGYEMLQRIKQLGLVFVEETQETKFGMKPFQDAYGYKRQ